VAQVVIFNDMTTLAWSRSSGPYRLATELRKLGYTCQVVEFFWFNAAYAPHRNIEALEKFVGPETLAVGFSTTFVRMDASLSILGKMNLLERFQATPVDASIYQNDPQTAFLRADYFGDICARVRSRAPRARLVIGGTRAPATLEDRSPLDVCVHGYADKSFIGLVKYLDGKNPFFQCTTLPNGKVLLDKDVLATGFDVNGAYVQWEDQDCLFPEEQLVIEISRGCIFRCKFCSFPLNGKSKNDFIKGHEILDWEFRRNFERYGITRYFFSDDTYNDSPEKMEYMHSLLTSLPFKIRYRSYLRHDLIYAHRQEAEQLLDSGLETAFFGIESMNHENLKLIGKGMRPEKVVENLHWLRNTVGWKDKVTVIGSFIIGLPHDTEENLGWVPQVEDINFPLDHVRMMGLNITPFTTVKEYHSEFDRSYAQYGYVFDDPRNVYYWRNTNTGMTYLRAWEIAKASNDRMFVARRDFQRTAYHTHNMALAMEIAATDTIDDFHARLMHSRLDQANRYHSRLMNVTATPGTTQ
jgi:hypothetical protein